MPIDSTLYMRNVNKAIFSPSLIPSHKLSLKMTSAQVIKMLGTNNGVQAVLKKTYTVHVSSEKSLSKQNFYTVKNFIFIFLKIYIIYLVNAYNMDNKPTFLNCYSIWNNG